MKKIIKLSIWMVCSMFLFISCQPNNEIGKAKTEIQRITFQDNVIHGDFVIEAVEKNTMIGKLTLTNLQTGRISFPFSGIVFKNDGGKGKVLTDFSKEKQNFFKDDRMDDATSKKMMDRMARMLIQSTIELETDEEKTFAIKVEFEKEIKNTKDVKIMLQTLYKQLLSKK